MRENVHSIIIIAFCFKYFFAVYKFNNSGVQGAIPQTYLRSAIIHWRTHVYYFGAIYHALRVYAYAICAHARTYVRKSLLRMRDDSTGTVYGYVGVATSAQKAAQPKRWTVVSEAP